MTEVLVLGYIDREAIESNNQQPDALILCATHYCPTCVKQTFPATLDDVITKENLKDLKKSSEHTIFCDMCKEEIG